MATRMAIPPTMDYTKWRTSKSFCLRRNQLAKVILVSKIQVKQILKMKKKNLKQKKKRKKSVLNAEKKKHQKLRWTLRVYQSVYWISNNEFVWVFPIIFIMHTGNRTKPKHMHTRIVVALKRLYKNNIYQVVMRESKFILFFCW